MRLEYELAYYDSTVHRFNHYPRRTPPCLPLRQTVEVEVLLWCWDFEVGSWKTILEFLPLGHWVGFRSLKDVVSIVWLQKTFKNCLSLLVSTNWSQKLINVFLPEQRSRLCIWSCVLYLYMYCCYWYHYGCGIQYLSYSARERPIFWGTSSKGLFRNPSDIISHCIHIVKKSCSQLPARSGIFSLLVEVVYWTCNLKFLYSKINLIFLMIIVQLNFLRTFVGNGLNDFVSK